MPADPKAQIEKLRQALAALEAQERDLSLDHSVQKAELQAQLNALVQNVGMQLGEGAAVGGDVTGRDKIDAGRDVIIAGEGTTVIVNPEAEAGPTVNGPQTNINGIVTGPVLSGDFHGPVHVGDVVIHRQTITPAEPPALGDPPYRGLAAFNLTDAEHFFGRANEIQNLKTRLELIAANPGPVGRFLAVVGASGSGKSSLVQAGLIPGLTAGGQWASTPVYRPQALSARLAEPDSLLPSGQPTLLVVDQFEEIYTAELSAAKREQFIHQLVEVARRPEPVCVLIVLRADFFPACLQNAELREALENRQFLLGAMSREALTQAIVRPAEQGGWEFEAGLVDVILDDVGSEPGNLPLLSQALLETWHRRAGRCLTLKGYRDAGGVERALANRAQAVYDSLPPAQQPIARHIFVQLTHLGEGQPDTRRRALMSQLPTQTFTSDAVQATIDVLANARLVVMDKLAAGDDQLAEVAHEALIRAWPGLRNWLDEDRSAEHLGRELAEDAGEWQKADRDISRLYRAGAKLAQAVEWLTRNPARTTSEIESFVLASQEQVTREGLEQRQRDLELELQKQRERVTRRAAGVIAVLAVGAVIAAIVATVFGVQAQQLRDQAQLLAKARELAFQADDLVAARPDLAGLLAVEADTRASIPETHSALLNALQSAPRLFSILTDHPGIVWSVAFSPDGQIMASGGGPETQSKDGIIYLWDVSQIEQPRRLAKLYSEGSGIIYSVAFSPDGRTLAAGNQNSGVEVWDITDPTTAHLIAQLPDSNHDIRSVAFSPDGKFLAAGAADNIVRVWDVSDLTSPQAIGGPLIGHQKDVYSVAFDPGGKILASGSADGTVRLWAVSDPANFHIIGEPLTDNKGEVNSVAFSPDGRTLAAGSSGQVQLWDVTGLSSGLSLTPRPYRSWRTGFNKAVISVTFSPDGAMLAVGGFDQTIQIWNVSDPAKPQMDETLTSHTASIKSLAFSPDGHTLVSASVDNSLRLWDVGDLNPQVAASRLRALAAPFPIRSTAPVRSVASNPEVLSVAFDPDSTLLAFGSTDGAIRLWSVAGLYASPPSAPKFITSLGEHAGEVWSVAFSPDGNLLASGSRDSTVRLWDVRDPAQAHSIGEPLSGHSSAVRSVAFSPDGKVLASGSADGTIRLWDIGDPANPRPLGGPLAVHTDEVWSVAFSPDGQVLASGGADGTVRLWDVSSRAFPQPIGDAIRPPSGPANWARSIAFGPDGQILAAGTSGSVNLTVRFWNLADPAHPAWLGETFTGHTASVWSVAFNPDGNILASGGADRAVRLWDLAGLDSDPPGAPRAFVQALIAHADTVNSVAFSPNGKLLASGSDDGTVIVWPAPALWREWVCRHFQRNFTQLEWRTYFGETAYHLTCPQYPAGP